MKDNKNMKDNIGFIALGQAGGNIGTIFEKQGYDVIFINTSPEDLATLTNAKHTYHIKNGEGCAKNRNKAKDLIIKDFNDISEQINQKLGKDKEYIYVIFSAGGGTGSGASPMLIELLAQYSNKKVGAITILPAESESPQIAINAYECFNELENIDNMGATFILDNENDKLDKFAINRRFVTLFNSFIDIPQNHSSKGNINKEEIRKILSTRGATIITKMTKNKSDSSNGNNSNNGNGNMAAITIATATVIMVTIVITAITAITTAVIVIFSP